MTPQNIFWAANLKHLRDRLEISQESLARQLNISRSKLAMHESGRVKNPVLEDVIIISRYFKMSVDTMLSVELSKLGELKLRELEAGNDVYVKGGNVRVLAISVDAKGRGNVTYVPKPAKAGYVAGFSDPEYIGTLPAFNMPNLPDNRDYRMFALDGDSMLPLPEKSLILSQYLADWTTLKETPAIVILRSEQDIVFKIVTYQAENNTLLLHSLNPDYKDKEVFVGDVSEVWNYHSHLTNVIPSSDLMLEEILRTVNEIKVDVKRTRL